MFKKSYKYFLEGSIAAIFLTLILNYSSLVNFANAATGTDGLPGEDLAIQDVFNIINGLACWLTRIATAVMVIFLVLAGLRYMAVRGDPSKLVVAKKNLRYVLIGILVIMGVYVIIATVANSVGTSFSFIPLSC